MNEFSNFVNGEIPENGNCNQGVNFNLNMNSASNIKMNSNSNSNLVVEEKLKKKPFTSSNPFDVYPFNPTGSDHPLYEKTLSLDALFYNQADSKFLYFPNNSIYHWDFHNLLGFTEGIATHEALDKMGFKLKFILTRSQMFGSGKYVQEWTGDNVATWEFLALSIPQILDS